MHITHEMALLLGFFMISYDRHTLSFILPVNEVLHSVGNILRKPFGVDRSIGGAVFMLLNFIFWIDVFQLLLHRQAWKFKFSCNLTEICYKNILV